MTTDWGEYGLAFRPGPKQRADNVYAAQLPYDAMIRLTGVWGQLSATIVTSDTPLSEVEDRDRPLYGLRSWNLRVVPDPMLFSPILGDGWNEREMIAACEGKSKNVVAHLEGGKCGCGIYAMKKMQHVSGFPSSETLVYGVVSLHGAVLEGERGYRAERARIERLYWPTTCALGSIESAVMATLEKRYECPVTALPPERFVSMAEQGIFEALIKEDEE